MQTPYIIYHGIDLDGKCSAAIALRALAHRDTDAETAVTPNPILIPYNYGWDPTPIHAIPDRSPVYLLDLTLAPEDMLTLNHRCTLTWIDHHGPAIRQVLDLQGWEPSGAQILAEEDRPAACGLTFGHFHPRRAIPRGVQFLSDYDSAPDNQRCGEYWHNHVMPYQYGVRSYRNDPTATVWDSILAPREAHQSTAMLIERGETVLSYQHSSQENTLQSLALYAIVFTQATGPAIAAVVNRPMNPSALAALDDAQNCALLISFVFDGRPGWRITLSPGPNHQHLHCGEIARDTWGGGGHPGCAGAVVPHLPWDDTYTNHSDALRALNRLLEQAG